MKKPFILALVPISTISSALLAVHFAAQPTPLAIATSPSANTADALPSPVTTIVPISTPTTSPAPPPAVRIGPAVPPRVPTPTTIIPAQTLQAPAPAPPPPDQPVTTSPPTTTTTAAPRPNLDAMAFDALPPEVQDLVQDHFALDDDPDHLILRTDTPAHAADICHSLAATLQDPDALAQIFIPGAPTHTGQDTWAFAAQAQPGVCKTMAG